MGQLGYRLGLIVVSAFAYFTVIRPELEGISKSLNHFSALLAAP